jgi:hypothetical protein
MIGYLRHEKSGSPQVNCLGLGYQGQEKSQKKYLVKKCPSQSPSALQAGKLLLSLYISIQQIKI